MHRTNRVKAERRALRAMPEMPGARRVRSFYDNASGVETFLFASGQRNPDAEHRIKKQMRHYYARALRGDAYWEGKRPHEIQVSAAPAHGYSVLVRCKRHFIANGIEVFR